jgi:hypothetical protein
MRQLMIAAIALLIGASSLLAQGHMGTPQEQQACTRDAQHFCRKQLGDDSAVQQCLQQYRTKLTVSGEGFALDKTASSCERRGGVAFQRCCAWPSAGQV